MSVSHDATHQTTSHLLINEPPLQVLPTLAVALGLNEAIFLQQLHYWIQGKSGRVHDGRRWIYNSLDEWHEQFPFWSVEAIRRVVRSLRQQGVLLTTTELNRTPMDRTLWYTIDHGVLNEKTKSTHQPSPATLQASKTTNGSVASDGSNQETTQETTQEKGTPLPPIETSATRERIRKLSEAQMDRRRR